MQIIGIFNQLFKKRHHIPAPSGKRRCPVTIVLINQGILSLKRQWQLKYGMGLRIVPSQKLAFLQYEFYDKDRQYIDMQEEIETNS